MSTAAKELTAPELATLRTGTHWSRLYLAFPDTPAVFKAQVNQTFTTTDKIYEITYDGVTLGAYTDIVVGMSLWIGSAAGLNDLGICRIRKTPTSSKLYINETSEIDWEDDLYLTVVDDFGIWAKQPYMNASKTVYMDRDVSYTNQHAQWLPFVVFGADRVGRLTGADLDFDFDASDSYVPGGTVASYAWSTTGGSLSSASGATTTLTVTTTGTYRITCTVTATTTGKTATGHRTVYVYSDAAPACTQFKLETSPSWGYERGGWEFGVTCWGQVDTIHDRQKVILFARDFYNGTETSIGQATGSENIVAIGWVDGESLEPAPDGSSVSFDVKGAHFWLNLGTAALIDMKNTSAVAAAKWTEMSALTIDLALAHFLQWRSTAPLSMDCILTGDTRQMSGFEVAVGTLWMQMAAIAAKIFAVPNCDPYNRLFVEIDPQYIPAASRGSIPTVMTITKQDWLSLSLERSQRASCSRLEMIGERWVEGGKGRQTLYSLANGHVYKRYGAPETVGEPVLADTQLQLNVLCGLAIARRNNPWPGIDIDLAHNNRAITGVPQQYVALSVAAGDTPLNVAFSGDIVPRAITFNWDEERGVLLTSLSGEAATTKEHAIKGDIPDSDVDPPDYPPIPPIPPIPPPPIYPPIPGEPPSVDDVKNVIVLVQGGGLWFTDEFDLDEPRWWSANAAFADESSLNNIRDFVVTPSGKIYVRAYEGIYAGNWGSPPALYKILDADWLETIYGYTPLDMPFFSCLGVNPNASDQIAIMAGSGYLGARVTDIWIGNSSNVTKGGNLAPNYAVLDGQLTYGQGKWLAVNTVSVSNTRVITRFTGAGVVDLNENNTADDGGGGEMAQIIGAGGSGNLFGWSNGHLWYSTDNGANRTTISAFTPAKNVYQQNQAVDVHANGAYLMGCDSTDGLLKVSTDAGQNWATILARTTNAVNCVSEDIWVAGGGNFLEVTADFGLNWTLTKSTNLNALLGTYTVQKIRAFV